MNSLKLALALGAFTLCGASASSGAVVYTQTSTTGLTFNSALVPYALEDVTFAPGSTTVPQTLSALTFGVAVQPTAATTAVVFFDFYNTVNSASTGTVESNFLGGFGGNLTITAATAVAFRSFNFTNLNTLLATPINFTDDNIGVVITLANAAGTAYSTILSPLLSNPGTPTIGTSLPGVYRDAANDGDFQATDFSATTGNLFLSLTTVNTPVPEPTTLALLGGFGTFGLLAFRRKRREATV